MEWGPRVPKKKQQYPPRLWERSERLKVVIMKRIVKTQRAPTDDLYYVSAADIADKLIDRMRRGWILFSFWLLIGSSPRGSNVEGSCA